MFSGQGLLSANNLTAYIFSSSNYIGEYLAEPLWEWANWTYILFTLGKFILVYFLFFTFYIFYASRYYFTLIFIPNIFYRIYVYALNFPILYPIFFIGFTFMLFSPILYPIFLYDLCLCSIFSYFIPHIFIRFMFMLNIFLFYSKLTFVTSFPPVFHQFSHRKKKHKQLCFYFKHYMN